MVGSVVGAAAHLLTLTAVAPLGGPLAALPPAAPKLKLHQAQMG